MKLSAKIIILISTALVLTPRRSVWFQPGESEESGTETTAQIERLGQDNIQRIKADGDRQAAAFSEELLALKKEYLKSQVQTAMSLLEAVEKDAGSARRKSKSESPILSRRCAMGLRARTTSGSTICSPP